MIIIGITGGIGSGKSTVSELLTILGIPVYISDKESKRLTDTSGTIKDKLIAKFGASLYKNGKLDKPVLSSLIFGNRANLDEVNNIIHPEVAKDFQRWVKLHSDENVVAIETAILFESGFDKLVDKTMLIYAPLELRIRRTIKRDNTTRQKVLDRINNQQSDEEKIELSDFVIVCDEVKSVIGQILKIMKDLKHN